MHITSAGAGEASEYAVPLVAASRGRLRGCHCYCYKYC